MNGRVGSVSDAIRGNAYGNRDEDGQKHRLVVFDLTIDVSQKQKRKTTTQRRIKWFKLKENDFQQEFKDRILRELSHDMVDVNTWRNDANSIILRAGKDILGENSGKIWENMEVRWFNEEVQEKVSAKKKAKTKWEESKLDEDRAAYKQCCREATKAVAVAKSEAYDHMYKH
ncbi:uncharacterized protein LOC119568091 [Penaeus monodon]|uniref:uncharacterized protein LOC119568091 n=1 Tax=Penaeus monodon TaxID=6687 RepID=UPI0018A764FE|nr:uncharacterized protein LOC119568091 [Penaeus monodon]